MRCPFCSNEDTQVVDTRSNPGTNVIRRRRRCAKCDKRFTTYERVELRMPRLVKKGGSRTDFDRDKLVGSMMLALGEREIPTTRVGDLVMRELARLDKIAYIRFASVYRSFESPEEFREAVQEVKAPRRRKKEPARVTRSEERR